MTTFPGRRWSLLLVPLLLLVAVLMEQWIALSLPWISETGGIRPMIVFLDIPLYSPVTIDCLPVGLLFTFLYSIVLTPGLPRRNGQIWPVVRKKVFTALTGFAVMLFCLLAGGGIFYLLRDYLSRELRNGIDSFGIQADLYLPYPGEGTIHLRGSMILLLTVYIGMRIWSSRLKAAELKLVPVAAAARTIRTDRSGPGAMRVSERAHPCVNGSDAGKKAF
jgi:hypothetical protein